MERLREVRSADYIVRMTHVRWRHLLLMMPMVFLGSCMDKESTQKMAQALQVGPAQPDEKPKVINAELPFRYPAALYARRVQGNVTLRLYIDRDGQVQSDSTRINESSGYAALDSAAIKGSHELRFIPAKLRGEPMPTAVLFPVYFRHPEAHALPGDTILQTPGLTSTPSTP